MKFMYFSIKYRYSDILLEKNNIYFINNHLFCWNHTCYRVGMVYVMSRYVTSVSCYQSTPGCTSEVWFHRIGWGSSDWGFLVTKSVLSQCSDLYKSDWKLQGNTNTQLKLLCRASYTGKWGGTDIIYLHDLPLSRFCNTQRNFSIVNQNF